MSGREVKRVAAFTGGRNDPSARLRIRQYINDLRACGINIDECYPPVGNAHPPSNDLSRIPWLLSQLKQRYAQTRHVRDINLSILQRQLIATINTFESFIPSPRILDVDDAIWLTCRFGSVDRLARRCEAVICGNDFLADHFSTENHDIYVVPTAIDTRIWAPPTTPLSTHRPMIGWIGTHGNYPYLYAIEWALSEALRQVTDACLLIISDAPPRFAMIPPSRVVYCPWSEANEISHVQHMTVGIMPLTDSPWARGKCGAKLLQYLACGVPAITSPVGVNIKIAADGGALLASSQEDWVAALLQLLKSDTLCTEIGNAGRSNVIQHYATEVVATRLAAIIRQFAY